MAPSAYASSSKVTLSHTSLQSQLQSQHRPATSVTTGEQGSDEDEEGQILSPSPPLLRAKRSVSPVAGRPSSELLALPRRPPPGSPTHAPLASHLSPPLSQRPRSSRERPQSPSSRHSSTRRDWRRTPSPPVDRRSHRHRSPPPRESHRPPRRSRSPSLERDRIRDRDDRRKSSKRDKDDYDHQPARDRDRTKDDFQYRSGHDRDRDEYEYRRARDRERDELERRAWRDRDFESNERRHRHGRDSKSQYDRRDYDRSPEAREDRARVSGARSERQGPGSARGREGLREDERHRGRDGLFNHSRIGSHSSGETPHKRRLSAVSDLPAPTAKDTAAPPAPPNMTEEVKHEPSRDKSKSTTTYSESLLPNGSATRPSSGQGVPSLLPNGSSQPSLPSVAASSKLDEGTPAGSRWAKLSQDASRSFSDTKPRVPLAPSSLRSISIGSQPVPTGPRAERGSQLPAVTPQVPTGPKAFSVSAQSKAAVHRGGSLTSSPATPTTPTLPTSASRSLPSQVAPPPPSAPAPPPPPEDDSQMSPPPPPPVSMAPPPEQATRLPRKETISTWKLVSEGQSHAVTSAGQQANHPSPRKTSVKDEIPATGSDPRQDKQSWRKHVHRSKRPARDQLVRVTWKWDSNSADPKPPPPARAILVTGLSPLASITMLRSLFRQFGRPQESALMTDPKTGESLGIYWHQFAHDFQDLPDSEDDGPLKAEATAPGQHGHRSASDAVANINGRRIGATTDACVVKVELDGQKLSFNRACRDALRIRHEKKAAEIREKKETHPAANGDLAAKTLPPTSAPMGHAPARRGFAGQQHTSSPATGSYASTSSPFTPVGAGRSPLSNSFRGSTDYKASLRRDDSARPNDAKGSDRTWARHQPPDDRASRRVPESSHLSGPPGSRRAMLVGVGENGADSTVMIMAQLASLGYPYVFIPQSPGSRAEHSLADIEQQFSAFSPQYMARDESGWYVGFDRDDAAGRSKFVCDKSQISGCNIDVQVRDAPDMTDEMHQLLDEREDKERHHDTGRRPSTKARIELAEDGRHGFAVGASLGPEHVKAHRRRTGGYTEKELREEAQDRILKELTAVLQRDCRARILGPYISEFLKPNAPGGVALKEAAEAAAQSRDQKAQRQSESSNVPVVDESAIAGDRLPSFRRKREPTPPRRRALPADLEDIDKAKMIERGRKARAAFTRELSAGASSGSPTLVSTAAAEDLQEDDEETSTAADAEEQEEADLPVKAVSAVKKGGKDSKGAKSRSTKTIVYSSDEDDQSAPETEADAMEVDEEPPAKKTAPSSASTKSKLDKVKKASKAEVVEEIVPKSAPVKASKAKSKSKAKTALEASRAASTPASATPELADVPESASLQAKVDAEEAILSKLASSATKKSKGGKTKAAAQSLEPIDPFASGLAEDDEDLYYLQQALDRLRAGETVTPASLPEDVEEPEQLEGDGVVPVHLSGSARTEGFYKIPPAQKAAHLPDRNKAIVETTTNVTLASARDNRADSRRLVLGIEQHKKDTASDTDILKFNQLRTRKKQLKFAKSPIHDWGLYAMEYIPANDMVIEYVGEVVRQQVADHREKVYEKQGNFSTYLFRVDDDLVVDATHKGNIARLMNHCCVPNCSAKILTLNGQKRIVLYAKVPILPGQELTYDYKFQSSGDEEDAIACLCGAEGCRRFL
ncbi:hypothetical protein BCV69DRAFT_280649 [Microstroma glucosiphilum]|uniref:Histone-lysine N-methyltransferase, H3 lysine-4 specific n=1 Tax=Pseudomicrostroma glucosiphilum TaxID=1684307 RepID=A0A316UCS4_9BASI|nr:hypothetical protein BCV69DRAFT_280649 [Pseudomicrostroma glucosiphilum]PWN23030.1 hypothetical protein BCV69DRAFT_280649 [Pseudomicrostroma glucosiphilum]